MMYEDDDPEAEATADLAVKGDMDFSQLGDPTKLLGMVQSTYDRQLEALNRSETNAKARFDAAEARIRERNRGPSQSEQLFMLSKALLAPRKYTGFGGTMGKISGAFGDISKADEKAREQRDAQLAALQDAYAAQGDAYGVTRAKTAADTLKTVAPLFKKPATSTASRVTVGPDARVRSRATGVELKEPPIDKIYAFVNYMKNPANTPENKAITQQNFDKKYGYGSADVYYEGQ
jgi:hypothetical protein